MTTTNHHSMELPQASTWKLHANMGGTDYQHPHHYYYYPQHHHQEEEEQMQHQREHLFEKPLTPSDVGKLNRLVIPKQHAEMHFPLDGESGEKGPLLGFEDESGKAWRFRYSYWTSSQSYVLTKGWSRFVKEKRLDAGDIVLFERRRSDADRLYIGWKRRGDVAVAAATTTMTTKHRNNAHAVPWNPVAFGTPQAYPHNPSANYLFPNGAVQQDYEVSEVGMQDKTAIVPVARSTATTNSKRLRLFGVNLECGFDVAESADTMAMHDGAEELGQGIDPRELQLLPCNGFSSSQS